MKVVEIVLPERRPCLDYFAIPTKSVQICKSDTRELVHGKGGLEVTLFGLPLKNCDRLCEILLFKTLPLLH